MLGLSAARASTHVTAINVTTYTAHSLVSASLSEVENAAVSFQRTQFPTRSGSATIAFSRFVREDELTGLGLPVCTFVTVPHPPLAVVIFRGDFSRTGIHASPTEHYKYVVYTIDLRVGSACGTDASLDGQGLGLVLNDKSLPAAPVAPASVRQAAPAGKIPYGSTLPPRRAPNASPAP